MSLRTFRVRDSVRFTFCFDGERVNLVDRSSGQTRAVRPALARVRSAFDVHGERRSDDGHAVVKYLDRVRS